MNDKPTTAIMPFEPENLEQAHKLATTLAASSLLPSDLQRNPANVLVQIITGREIGLGAMQAIRSIHVIKGKPTMSAELMAALVKRSPECEYLQIIESTESVATYETKRRGDRAPTRISFTMDEAKKAGLAGPSSNYARHPAAMLRARAASAICRAVYPDLLLGIYEESEADEIRANERAAQVERAAAAHRAGAPAAERVVEGEVVAAQAAAPDFDPEPLLASIEQAATLETLKSLVPALQAAPAEHKQALRAAYNARQQALRAPPPEVVEAEVVEEPQE